MKLSSQDDRRRFFRITDAIGIVYEAIDNNETESIITNRQPEKQTINIKHLLDQHNAAIQSSLKQLEPRQPEVANVIVELNKKLDILFTLFQLDEVIGFSGVQQLEQASISASGIGFPVNESLVENSRLKLTLYLQPSGKEVQALSKVIDCQACEPDGFYLRVEFIEISDSDRESLIQHIVQRQGALLKSLREKLEQG